MSNRSVDPKRYFESVGERKASPEHGPVCLYLETTNRCNLLCTTCPRTYAELEPPADMSWELFTSIVEQTPELKRAVLHGVGEPKSYRLIPGKDVFHRILRNVRAFCELQTREGHERPRARIAGCGGAFSGAP